MTDQIVPLCRDCKFYRRERSFLWMIAFPIIGWFSAPGLLRESHKFAKCHSPKSYTMAQRGFPGYVNVEREDFPILKVCGPSGLYFERRN